MAYEILLPNKSVAVRPMAGTGCINLGVCDSVNGLCPSINAICGCIPEDLFCGIGTNKADCGCNPLKVDCGPVVGVICHTRSVDTFCPVPD